MDMIAVVAATAIVGIVGLLIGVLLGVASEKFKVEVDEKEILVRLLGYGPYIKILASEDNYVLEEIKRRIAVQRDLTQTQKMEHVLTLS